MKIKLKKAIVNKVGCFIARWIIHNCKDGFVVTRKTGEKQVIKVYSVQAYENVIKPAVHSCFKKEDVHADTANKKEVV